MASTKIINVLKDDKFEEILDLFRSTSAKEVIFVLPKASRAFKKEEHFVILENEAVKASKKISLLCSSPETNKLAQKYKFDVLLAKNGDNKPLITAVNQYNSEKDEEEIEEPVEKLEEPAPKFYPAMFREDNDRARSEEVLRSAGRMYDNNEYEVVTVAKTRGGLEGIIKQEGRPLRVALPKERPKTLEIKKSKRPIYDSAEDIKNVWREQSERESVQIENIWAGINSRTKKSFKNFPRKSLVILGGVSVVILGVIMYVSLGSAKVDITPLKQPLDIQLKVSASDKFSFVDAGLNKIPGQLFNVEKNATQTFATTGQKDVAQKARGKITVFNEYGTTPQVLIATTRFQTSDGLIFRTLTGVTVPGTKVENGKIIPGSVKVEVIADKPGQAYNIPPSKFMIPAFNERGDAGRYEKIYGRSDEAMKGGIIGTAKVVTESDYNTAKEILIAQVTNDVQDSLKTQTSGLKIINAGTVKLKAPESNAKIDEAADELMMTISGSIKTIGFKEEDLMGLIKQYVDKTKNLTAIPEKLTISYTDVVFDEVNNTLTFTVNIKGNGYAKIDIEKIKIDLMGKKENEIRNYLKAVPGVESAKVVLSPFWVKKIPQDKDKIKIQINY